MPSLHVIVLHCMFWMHGHFKRVFVNSWCSMGKQITFTFFLHLRPHITPLLKYKAQCNLCKLKRSLYPDPWQCYAGHLKYVSLKCVRAETYDAANCCDTLPRHVAATNRLVWHVKIIVVATEFCRYDLSHEFKHCDKSQWQINSLQVLWSTTQLSCNDFNISYTGC